MAEGKAIVDEIVRRLSDNNLASRSMGIVTFSVAQQILIEDLLTEVFLLRPDLEKLATDANEPLFVKNLENVQGDERDVILFSICYGPDEQGRVSLNFGPINREGGWRRLNVAVSRARYEMLVFTTLKADQIDLNRSGSDGVAGLKAFLAYAEKGKSALPVRHIPTTDREASFENGIADQIRKKGYDVHTHVGCSDYKIDIAVVDPQQPSQYILGIFTDGKNYHRAATTKDREIVQMDVLRMLGWNIHRIWSTECWEHPERVMNGILEAIDKAIENRNKVVPADDEPIERIEEQTINTSIVQAQQEEEPMTTIPSFAKPANQIATTYTICVLPYVNTTSSEEFLYPQNRGIVRQQIQKVLLAESPISKNLLCKRVLAAWGINRMGSRLGAHFETLFLEMQIISLPGKRAFFWRQDQNPADYAIYRIPANETGKRDADDLPPQEVANAVHYILRTQISLTRSDLQRETSKLFGFVRMGGNVENAMNEGIDTAIALGYARENLGRVVYGG